MKIYLASRFGRRQEMLVHRGYLEKHGYVVTSRWVTGILEAHPMTYRAVADKEDLEKADILVTFTEPEGSANVGGGRHWEFGYAYAKGIPCYLIGPQEMVFHHLPGLFHFAALEDVVHFLEQHEVGRMADDGNPHVERATP